jgi:hypothetical protein
MKPTTIQNDSLYFTDNGAIYCGAHLGTTARYTGRDLSGQPIERVTPDDVRQAQTSGFALKCETCERAASLLVTA